jgi:hypothetical protein
METKPPELTGQETPAVQPSDWTEKMDPTTGKVYYVNQATKQTCWTKPPEVTEEGTAAVQPSDWTEKMDPTTGKLYYVNKVTKENSRIIPPELRAMRNAPPPTCAPVQGPKGVAKPDPKPWKV